MPETPGDLIGKARREIGTQTVLIVRFGMPDGSTLERSWTWAEVDAGLQPRWPADSPPDWLVNARRSWSNPQEPIVFTGQVKPGREEDARAVVLGERAPDA